MKKIVLIFSLFLFTFSTIKSQDYRYIPDANFRAFLITSGCPFDASGDSLDIGSPFLLSIDSIDCQSRIIYSIEGIQYFTNLNYLDCSYNSIDSISSLPSNLLYFSCSNNALLKLPTLPSTLIYIQCERNALDSLPSLPVNLTTLVCNTNRLTSLPTIPLNLMNLSCYQNSLSYLPTLSPNLEFLECDANSIVSLPPLPNGLKILSCGNNLISSLPTLPDSLDLLTCQFNSLLSLPNLPSTLTILYCNNNPSLQCLPFLPNSLNLINYDFTSILCIPNFVSGATYLPPIGTYPYCNPLIHSCPSYIAIDGLTYFDNNSNCIFDTIEHVLANLSINLKQDTTLIQALSTSFNGIYAFNSLTIDTYFVHIDTSNIPFSVSCPISGFDTINIDSSHLFYSDRNFALQCKPGFDIGTTGLINTSAVRPATPVSFDLHAGDMASLYGVHCTSISGKISLDYSGPMYYTGVSAGTLLPDSILSNRLVWNIADFSLLDFNNDIKPNFFVDSSALVGDLVCFSTEVTPSIGDRVPSNNTFSQCFDVRTAYDPNYKEVSPSGSVTASQDWMYYTIHFQNLGNSYAENIYVWDTIDTNLNLNTIQVMGASHSQFMQVHHNNRSVLFNFQNIMLQDSATNEPESKGWVQYRIKPNAGLAEGVQIHNTASILFDLNAPIVTNTVTNRICNTPSNISQSYTIAQGQSISVGTHTYTTSGRYTDVLSNINGCDSIVTTTLQVVSGIAYENPLRILMYPNPANHQVLIQIEGVPTESVSIVDMYGRKVFESETISSKYFINTESWSNGTYIIQCGNKRGKLIVNH
jgi:uncharacterized repeat protein (TIGR01451 family)